MADFLLGQIIGTKPVHIHDNRQQASAVACEEPDAYSLCAGIALGMVTLGRGGTFGDMDLEVRLCAGLWVDGWVGGW
jgi:hypothetical protein